jgi:putative DNA primase/helicase
MTGDLERIREALHFIPPIDRDVWLKTGMGIKSEFGDEGFDLWDEWSQADESYEPNSVRVAWKSIRANGKVTIGTLIREAKARGWRDDGAYQKPTPGELAARRCVAAERADKEEAEIARERAETAKKAAEWLIKHGGLRHE